MSEPKLISPMLDNFDMGDPISHHNGVRCCPAMEKDSDKKYIVKIISIPASQVQLDALLITGAYQSAEAACAYFKELSDSVVEEAQILQKLSGLEGFLPYESWQVVPKEQETGYDVYLLSPYRRTLEKHFRRNSMTHLGAVNLGLDLCAAMAVCRHSGYLYADLKPGNVCIVDDNAYRICDLGFIKLDALKYASLPEKYHSQYTAPEISDAFSALNATIDIYAAGLILYQAYNDGILPFKGEVPPAEVFPAPAYADYEMAEIILKACAPDPKDRWQDPIQMGQALVSYMQRNGANDTPIIPIAATENTATAEEPIAEEVPAAPEEPTADEVPVVAEDAVIADNADQELEQATPEEGALDADVLKWIAEAEGISEEDESTDNTAASLLPEGSDESIYVEDDFGNLTFLIDAAFDETAPDSEAEDIEYHEVSNEVSEILSYADELIAHPTPEPVIPPDPISVPIPEPLPVPPDPEQLSDEETGEAGAADAAAEPGEELEVPDISAEAEIAQDEKAEVPEYSDDTPAPRKSIKQWIIGTVCIILILALAAFGFYYYQHYYLQPVSIEIDGTEDSLTVYVSANVDEKKLTVICADTYGNSLRESVADGKAVFENLAPGAGYTVSVEISGFHRLTGNTSTAYSTPIQTNIVQFNAITGSEDGSVILSFAIDGPDSQKWTVDYSAEGEENRTEAFSGHMVTITGLTVGKEYAFTLGSENSMFISGNYQLKWTASEIVYAEALEIVSCDNNKLTAVWKAPENVTVEFWTVRCYNDSGFDETITTAETTAVFENLDHTDGYTVEVTAANMTVGERVYIGENSATVTGYSVDASDPGKLTLSWNTTQPLADGNWILLYSADGSDTHEALSSSENAAVVEPAIPDSTYTFTLITSTGSYVFNNTYSYTAAEAPQFSNYNVTSDHMEFNMCKTPDVDDWDRFDLSASDYKTTFAIGEKASFLVRMRHEYNPSGDTIVTMFVIRDSDNNIVNISTSERTWLSMWYKNYCELDIPAMPSTAGNYTITVYFNGYFASERDFTIANT